MQNMPDMNFTSRLLRLRTAASLERGDVFYVSALANIRYLSGFSGSAGVLLVTAENAILVTDGRYEAAAREICQAAGVDVIAATADRQVDVIKKALENSKRLLLDPSQVSMDNYWQLKESAPSAEVIHTRHLLERLRLSKDEGEIARIRAACGIALQAFSGVSDWLDRGLSEQSIANRLEASMKDIGAESVAFDTIVASGPNSAKPHHQPGGRIPQEGEPIIVDFGAVVDGYCSDIARTVWLGELREEYWAMYTAAAAAHDAGIDAVRAGVSHAEVDKVCRKTFENHGFREMPLHPSGHNVGLSIHERPFLSPYAREEIGEGFILTVEPGLYRPLMAGCRMEDTLLVKADGVEILSGD